MITNKLEYMLLILVDLARHSKEGYILSREIAERQQIPPKYMPQLMAALTRRGWVESVRGAKGGVRLAVDPGTIRVQDVIDATGDDFNIKQCLHTDFPCQRKPACPLFPIWEKAQKSVRGIMESTTVADLASQSR